jgi:hypothetical protein
VAETAAPSEAQILYLEPDDEIPSVVRRVRESDLPKLVLVAPGRSKATSSAIGLRLIARHANEVGREVSLVADPAARTLAAEAGIPAYASLADAQAEVGGSESLVQPAPRPLAAIHVVRGEPASPAAMPVVAAAGIVEPQTPPTTTARRYPRIDETQARAVVAPPVPAARQRRATRGARISRSALAAAVAGLLLAAALVAAVLPSATVRIIPGVSPVGPVSYSVSLPAQSDSGRIESSLSGNASGTYSVGLTPADGVAMLLNYSSDSVRVPKGTPVAAGNQIYLTDKSISVPATGFFFAGRRSVHVTASSPGTPGNVASHAIDTVRDKALDNQLSAGFLQIGRRVDNADPTSGGTSKTGPQVTQKDVDALVARIKQDLAQQLSARLASHPERSYALPADPEEAGVPVPAGLVGTKDKASFQLIGSLDYQRRYVTSEQIRTAARERLAADGSALPAGTSLVSSSIQAEASDLQLSGELVSATVQARGAVTPSVDVEQLKQRIAGLSAGDAQRALRDLGATRIDLWPSWVSAVPRLPFRIDIAVEAPPAASPSTAPSAAPSAAAS